MHARDTMCLLLYWYTRRIEHIIYTKGEVTERVFTIDIIKDRRRQTTRFHGNECVEMGLEYGW